jgi:predicted RNase H-like nuclease (RuvC/YqgF family)
MDELDNEDLKKLVIFYSNRASEAELKNAQFQLITNKLKIQNASLNSQNKKLQSEIEKLSEKLESITVKKVKKTLTRED